jgi:hypothetical protein
MFPSFEDISKRLLKSKYDKEVFKKLVDEWLHHPQFYDEKKKYDQKKSYEKIEVLLKYAEKLASSKLDLFKGKKPNEIIVEAIVELIEEGTIPIKWRNYIFGHSDEERELYPLVKKGVWEKHKKAKLFETADMKDLPCGNPDFVLLEKGLVGESLIAVEVKANKDALKNFFNQALNYRKCYDIVYLATTGWCAISHEKSLSKINFLKLKFLHDKLHSVNARLMYVDLTGKKWFFELENEKCFPDNKLKSSVYSKLFSNY